MLQRNKKVGEQESTFIHLYLNIKRVVIVSHFMITSRSVYKLVLLYTHQNIYRREAGKKFFQLR